MIREKSQYLCQVQREKSNIFYNSQDLVNNLHLLISNRIIQSNQTFYARRYLKQWCQFDTLFIPETFFQKWYRKSIPEHLKPFL